MKHFVFIITAAFCAAAATVNTTIDAAADTDIRQTSPDYAKADRDVIAVNGYQNGDYMKAYIKFKLPADFGTAEDVEFIITPAFLINPSWTLNYAVFGLKDAALGNDWPDKSPGIIEGQPYTGGLSWNNAPANDTSSGTAFTSEATSLLAEFTTKGSLVGTAITVKSQALVDFINTDTDMQVTVMIVRTVGNTNSEDTFASIENTQYDAPKLNLTYFPAEIITKSLITAADTDVREKSPNYALASRDRHLVKNAAGDSAKAYFKFILPENISSITDAKIILTRASAGAWNFTYNVYGLLNMAIGNDWLEKNPGALQLPYTYLDGMTWNSAPGNDPNSAVDFVPNLVQSLTTFQSSGANYGGSAGDVYEISSDSIIEFLNADTDGSVTFMLSRNGSSTSYDTFAAKENTAYQAPVLLLSYRKKCPIISGDINQDCKVDSQDLLLMVSDWLQ